MAKRKLTGKQQRFINEYIKCLNASEAARRAGYAVRQSGDHNMSNHVIRAEIERRLEENTMSANEVLHRLSEQARGIPDECLLVYRASDHSMLVGVDMERMKALGLSHLVKRISYDDDGTPQYHFYDAQSALQTLAKYHQLTTTTRHEVDDWRSRAIEDIRTGRIPPEAFDTLAEKFDEDLAEELFRLAGVPVERD